MKAVLILAAIAAILFLVSLIRIGAQVKYSPGELALWVKVGPVRRAILPHKEKKRTSKKKQGAEKTEPRTNDLPGQIRRALPLITEAAGRLKRKIRLDRVYLDVSVGTSDPASAALAFGGVNAAVGMIWPLVEQNFNVKDRRIRTQVDFSASSTDIWLDGAATLTVGQALALAFWLVPKLPEILGTAKEKQEKKRTDTVQKEAV